MSEDALVTNFIASLNSKKTPFCVSNIAQEYSYKSGCADVIAKTEKNELYAFEAKLTDWRKALYQAYRSTSYAHFCYVVLPENKINLALKKKHEFERRGIGLCGVGAGKITIEIEANKNKPFMPWLTKGAMEILSTG